jgi:hypothetical protein
MCAYLLSLNSWVLAADANTDEEPTTRRCVGRRFFGDMHLGWRANPLPPNGEVRGPTVSGERPVSYVEGEATARSRRILNKWRRLTEGWARCE